MGKKRPSLNHQMSEKLLSLLKIGESRKIAKKEYKKYCLINNIPYINGQALGIYSWLTYTAYKQTLQEFSIWLKENYSIRFLADITRDMCLEYLSYRTSKCSPWTVDKDKSALNKVFEFRLTKKEYNGAIRSIKNIKRSRLSVAMDKHYNLDNYKNHILVSNATGCRRSSMLKITRDDFVFEDNLPFCVRLKEKGGRVRYAIILNKYKKELNDFLNTITNTSTPIFTTYTKTIDNHAFRSSYANTLYKELEEGGHNFEKISYWLEKDI